MNDCLCCSTIRFHLIMDDCVRPIPNNSVPNPVLLSMITDQNVTRHLAYYAPVARNSWTNFNSTNLSLNEIPIYSPGSCNTYISIDIDDNVDGFLLVWTQYNYIPDGERWTIQRRGSNQSTFMAEQQLYCYSNGDLRENNRRILMKDGNGSSPRVVSLCFKKYSNATCPNFSIPMNPASSLPNVSHDNITCLHKCTPDNIWPETPIGEIARGTCGKGIFNGM